MADPSENSNGSVSELTENYGASKLEKKLAELLRLRGWEVTPPEDRNISIYANQLDLSTRAYNCLASAYDDAGERPASTPRSRQLTQKPFTPQEGSECEGDELMVYELAKDIRKHENVILRTRNLGKSTLHEIKNALEEFEAL
jgi:DNA-directed RNA polymerase alpha subunit